MDLKLIEIRDRGTFIPAFAFRARPPALTSAQPDEAQQLETERWLLARAGYGRYGDSELVVMGTLECSNARYPGCTYDPYGWDTAARTYPEAHRWVTAHWDEIKSGDVIDVEFILGETKEKKVSERV